MTAGQADLFAGPALPGLSQADGIVLPDEEPLLIAEIDAAGLAPFQFHGWQGRRLSASYGWRYDFGDMSLTPAAPIPGWLMPLRERAARFAGLAPGELAQALLLRYDRGAGIGWHRDRPVFEHVLGISLGAPATLRFRRPRPGGFARAMAPLRPRSIYHLTGPARYEWQHSIAAMPATRWSITFRSLAARVRVPPPD